MKLKPEIQELVDWAQRHRWKLDSKPDGKGHPVLRKGGSTVRLPLTPSDHRGLKNAYADIRRISGIPSESGPAAKYKHEPKRKYRDRFDMDAAIREREERRKQLEAEAAELHELHGNYELTLDKIKRCDPRKDAAELRQLAGYALYLRRELLRRGVENV